MPRLTVVIAAVSLLVVIASAGSVLVSGRHLPAERPPEVQAALEADDDDQPDPTAVGVIAGRSQGWLYTFSTEGQVLGKAPDFAPSTSADGFWQAGRNCPGNGQPCQLLLFNSKQPQAPVTQAPIAGSFWDGGWSPVGDTLAAVTDDGRIYIVDAVALTARQVGADALTFGWKADGTLVFTTWDGSNGALWSFADGSVRRISELASAVSLLVPSPDDGRFAFAQDGATGWRLSVTDGASVVDLADLGARNVVPARSRAPDVAISWSPDGRRIAVSPVEAPFVMYLLASDAPSEPRSFYFAEGYAGEMKWSPDGSQLAVSTYSLDRTQHRIYVMDSPASTALRRLIDGCLIFWSPDGRFLVAKPEPYADDIAAVRVSDGAYWMVAGIHAMPQLTPASWGSDEADALKLASLPARGIGGLGK